MGENTKMLIVEDDDLLREVLKERFTKEGYLVSIAEDGEKALRVIPECEPEIILLDLLLPGISGFEVLENVRQNELFKDLPVVILSNMGEQRDIDKADDLGASGFLVKSNNTLDEIISKVWVIYNDLKKD